MWLCVLLYVQEFYSLGDLERSMGVPIGPLCDRERDTDVAKSQLGFFQFICVPFFHTVADLIDPHMATYRQLMANHENWKAQQQVAAPDEPTSQSLEA